MKKGLEGWFVLDPQGPMFKAYPVTMGKESSVNLRCRELFMTLIMGDIAPIKSDDHGLLNSDFYGRGFVLCHNHPSGSKKSSEQDDKATMVIAHVGKMLEIEIIDHWIFYDDDDGHPAMTSYASYKPEMLRPSVVLLPEGRSDEAKKRLEGIGL